MKVGIVVLNYNTFDDTSKCIESIKSMTNADYKIFLVDNASKKDCIIKLAEKYKNDCKVELLYSDYNLGYSGGNNIGIKKALEEQAEYIMIVNSDVIFCNDVVVELISGLNGDVVLAGPKVTRPDGSDGQQLMGVYTYKAAFLDRQPFYFLSKYIKALDNHIDPADDKLVFSGMVGGCCFMITSEAFKKVDLFDDNVFLYSEERILGIKLNEIGCKVMYNPNAKIIHAEGKSTGRINSFSDYHRYASDYYCIVRYIRPGKFGKSVLKYMRLLNYKIKSIRADEYKSNYVRLKNKFKQIDNGNYKITF